MPHLSRQNRNIEIDFRSEKQSHATYASTTGPDVRLYKQSPGAGAVLCFMRHALMENWSGLIVQGDLTRADGHAERKAALDMIHEHSPGSTRQLTLGTDRGYHSADFIRDLRQARITPHVSRRARYSAVDGRTIRHENYALSQRHRKRIEQPFGWTKTGGGSRAQTSYHGGSTQARHNRKHIMHSSSEMGTETCLRNTVVSSLSAHFGRSTNMHVLASKTGHQEG